MSPTVPATVDTAQARELLRTTPRTRLIDVRTPGEFASAHIPGSVNVPLDLLRAHRANLSTEHDDPIVLVCAAGPRADQAREVLEKAGFGQLSVLKGGLTSWEADGGAMNRGRGTWAMERQVRLVAGSVVLAGVLGSTIYSPLKWVAGAIGAGLTVAALTNTCAMGRMLSMLPHNRPRRADSANSANRADRADPRTVLRALTAS